MKLGNFKSNQISYIKLSGTYVMTGTDPFDSDDVVWWFIKPTNHLKLIKIGGIVLFRTLFS